MVVLGLVFASFDNAPAPGGNGGNGWPVACTMDAKICPDGSAVGRIGPDCEFAPCPGAENACDYDGSTKKYAGKSKDICSRIKYQCAEGTVTFSDECGCGCQAKEDSEPANGNNPGEGKLAASDCRPEERGAEICTMIYKPVCGWWNSEKIQCFAYPCAQTYPSRCQACANEDVISVTEGECPKPGESQTTSVCGNGICEEGENGDPGGCPGIDDPSCLGAPASIGSCPSDCST